MFLEYICIISNVKFNVEIPGILDLTVIPLLAFIQAFILNRHSKTGGQTEVWSTYELLVS